MTPNSDLQKAFELVQEINKKMDNTMAAMVALGEIVRVGDERREQHDGKLFDLMQRGQVQQKRRDDELKEAMRVRDELLCIIADELSKLGPALAHASEEFTRAAQRVREGVVVPGAKKKSRAGT